MDSFNALVAGFGHAITPINLLWAFTGCLIGTAVGVLPGIGPALTLAMLLPLTAKLEPAAALIMFAGIYYGAMFGGSTTSILMNTPGESATMITAMEGNTMARNGRAGPALASAAIGSFVAGTIATVLLSLIAPAAADFALRFGPAEYFMIMVLAFTTVSAVLGTSMLRGLTALFIGLGIGLIGIEATSGQTRYALGIAQLYDGIDIVVVAVALFAVGEALYGALYFRAAGTISPMSQLRMNAQDWRRSAPAWIRGSLIGFPFGLIPAGGAEIPTFLSYAAERKLSKHQSDFSSANGPGAIEGVAGPEAANNAATTAVLAPLLTLGIPVTSTSAIMLAAFQNYNLQPGPALMQTSGELVWTLIASLYIGNVMLLILNLPLVGLWVKVLRLPTPVLYGSILIFSSLGAYSLRQSWFDLALLFIIGLMGLAMRRFGFPTAPVVVGMILGPMSEKQLRNALAISQGDWSIFVTKPICLVILILLLLILIVPRLLPRLLTRRASMLSS